MSRYLPTTWLLAALILVTLGYLGPAIDDHGAEQAQADALQDAQRAAQAVQRFAKAAAKACGSANGGFIEQADGSVRCTLHTGRPTARVAMVAR